MPEIQAPEVAAKLRKAFAVKGVGDISSLAPEIVPVVLVADLASISEAPEHISEKDVYLFQGEEELDPDPAEFAHIQIGIPEDTTGLVPKSYCVIQKVVVRITPADRIYLRLTNSQLTTPVKCLRTDMRQYAGASAPARNAVTTMYAESVAGQALGTVFSQQYIQNNVMTSVLLAPVILGPDRYLVVSALSADTVITANFSGYEWTPSDVP